MKILLVDDSKTMRNIQKKVLSTLPDTTFGEAGDDTLNGEVGNDTLGLIECAGGHGWQAWNSGNL